MTSEPDSGLAALDAPSRAKVALVWRTRAASERNASGVFASLHRALSAVHADPVVLALAAQAIDDELRHAEICVGVAERYSATLPTTVEDEATPGVVAGQATVAPVFRGCDQRENTLLFAVLQCCLSETVAVAFLKTCMERAEGPVVRAALRALLRDEVNHSRIGWAHLASASVGAHERRVVAEAMPELLDVTSRLWLSDPDGLHENAPANHGTLTHADIAVVLSSTVEAIVIPGLEHVGVESRPSRAWLKRYAPP